MKEKKRNRFLVSYGSALKCLKLLFITASVSLLKDDKILARISFSNTVI